MFKVNPYSVFLTVKPCNLIRLAAFDQVVTADDLIDGKYLLVQKGKKNYFLITVK